MWSEGSLESLQAQALGNELQSALIVGTAIVLITGCAYLISRFRNKGQTEGKPMSAKRLRKHKAAIRQQYLKTKIADGITDAVEKLYLDKEITDKERRALYNQMARSAGLWDLARRFRWTTPSPDVVKASIRERLADPKYKEAAKLPDLVEHTTEAKPAKTFRKAFGERLGLRVKA